MAQPWQHLSFWVGLFFLGGSVAAIVGVALIAIQANRRQSFEAFADMVQRASILKLLTVAVVVGGVVVLALEGKLDSSATSAIIAGVTGYVLGGLGGPTRGQKSAGAPGGDG
jgi:hypothetical protein